MPELYAHDYSLSVRYRVAQWSTGNIGRRSLRRIIEHPNLQLVAVFAHGVDKFGRDAGELCDMPRTGIKATNSLADIISARPDCVVYMPSETSYDDLCTLLASGINVVTTRGDFLRPDSMKPDLRARIETACDKGQSSIHSTGISPGFKTEMLPFVLLAIERRLDELRIEEFSDVSMRNSPEMLFDVMGFGARYSGAARERQAQFLESFGPSLALVADAVGLPLDGLKVDGAVGIARADTLIVAGLVPAGTIAATRTTVTGMREGRPLMRFSATWYVSTDVETSDGDQWEFPAEAGWKISIRGDTPLDLHAVYPVAPDHYAGMTPNLTAHPPINAIPYVCEAEPGIRTSLELPWIVPNLSGQTR